MAGNLRVSMVGPSWWRQIICLRLISAFRWVFRNQIWSHLHRWGQSYRQHMILILDWNIFTWNLFFFIQIVGLVILDFIFNFFQHRDESVFVGRQWVLDIVMIENIWLTWLIFIFHFTIFVSSPFASSSFLPLRLFDLLLVLDGFIILEGLIEKVVLKFFDGFFFELIFGRRIHSCANYINWIIKVS